MILILQVTKMKFREVKYPIKPTRPGNGGAGIQAPSSPGLDLAFWERTPTTLPEPPGPRRSQAHSMCAHGLWGPRPPNSNKHLSDVSGHFPPLLWVLGKTELPLKGPPQAHQHLYYFTLSLQDHQMRNSWACRFIRVLQVIPSALPFPS